jgi:hypothetical protein
MATVLSQQPPMPLDRCFTYRCPNQAKFIFVTVSQVGYSLMCQRCRNLYQQHYALVDVRVEHYTRERAEELDQLVRETYDVGVIERF